MILEWLNRKREIANFYNKVKAPCYVSFAVIESMIDMNVHSDVIHFLRSIP